MNYCLVHFPDLDPLHQGLIRDFRRRYDPTADSIPPHVTLMFPTHASVGESRLIDHVDQVVAGFRPITIRLGGFHQSRDFWLFLRLLKGEQEIKELYQSLYSGLLADGRDFTRFVPHVGLGLFIKPGRRYDWRNPQETDFDMERFHEALQLAETTLVQFPESRVERLHLVSVADSWIDWTFGRLPAAPEDAPDQIVHEFRLT